MTTNAFSTLDLTGKTFIVTGAASGIGRASAVLLAARGASVAVADVNQVGGKETVDQIASAGGTSTFIRTDVASETEVRDLVEQTVQVFGRLDGAFNNAGIGPQSELHKTTADEWNTAVGVNLTGMFYCLKHEIAYLLEHGGGSIVNTSSLAGYKAVPGMPAYVSSKHGVVGLTRAASLEYAARGIRVNAILPGTIRTPMLDSVLHDPALAQALADGQPIGRIGAPEDIAEQAAWLLSDASKFSTGTLFFVDGGSNGV
ncbi:SDR family NAD(P)-dependent oxidoreductase [Nocardia nova]|uniref:Oxidoreductase n=1 Tax=Nocardia nova TaxID=37330 RepID=A0A2S6A253_9NOCA|nr:SDR family oxidoreductase [Nocardia nova]PPJ25585.1 oxidoreductase [Nocardia nova]